MKIEAQSTSVNEILSNESRLDQALASVRKLISVTRLTKALGGEKRSGHKVYDLFYLSLFCMPLSGARGSILTFFRTSSRQEHLSAALYRLMKNVKIDWRKVQLSANTMLRELFRKTFSHEERSLPRLLLIDDTLLRKCGRKIQGCSHVHDHTDGSYQNGFKLLAMMYFNGFYAHFLDFSLHAEGKWQQAWGRLKQTLGCTSSAGSRCKELGRKKTDIILEMIRRHRHFKVDYLLADSWFCSLSFIKSLLETLPKGCHILMHAKMDNTEYYLNADSLNLKAMLRKIQADKLRPAKRCKEFNCQYYTVEVFRDGKFFRIFFSRLNKSDRWVAFLTTNPELSFIQAMRIYALRWKIETGFRDLKQHFNISRCQANSFNAQLAHITQAFILHALMSHHVACNQNLTSIGELFREAEQDYLHCRILGKHWKLFVDLLNSIAEQIGGADKVSLTQVLKSAPYLLVESMIDQMAKWPGRWNSSFFLDHEEFNENEEVI